MFKSYVQMARHSMIFHGALLLTGLGLMAIHGYFAARIDAMNQLVASFNLDSVLYSQVELGDGKGPDLSAPLKSEELAYLRQLSFVREVYPNQESRRSVSVGQVSFEAYRSKLASPALLKALAYRALEGVVPEQLGRDELILTEVAARKLFGNTAVVGQRLLIGAVGQAAEQYRVAAVLADRHSGLDSFEDFVFFDKDSSDYLKAGFRVLPTDLIVQLRSPAQAKAALPILRDFFERKNKTHNSFRQFVHPGTRLLSKTDSVERLSRLQVWFALGFFAVVMGGFGIRAALLFPRVRRELALRLCFGATPKQLWQSRLRPELLAVGFGILLGLSIGLLGVVLMGGGVGLSLVLSSLGLVLVLMLSVVAPYLNLDWRRPLNVLRQHAV